MNLPYKIIRIIIVDRIVIHPVDFKIKFLFFHSIRAFVFFLEDSQGNINPYAVTGCKDQDSWFRENKHTDTIGMK
jgi:hypothetical protein